MLVSCWLLFTSTALQVLSKYSVDPSTTVMVMGPMSKKEEPVERGLISHQPSIISEPTTRLLLTRRRLGSQKKVYKIRGSGKCGDGKGESFILTLADCNDAVTGVGWNFGGNTKEIVNNRWDYPKGCFRETISSQSSDEMLLSTPPSSYSGTTQACGG